MRLAAVNDNSGSSSTGRAIWSSNSKGTTGSYNEYKQGGTVVWACGAGANSDTAAYEIYSNTAAGYAVEINATTRAIRWAGYGAGTLTTDASGNITAASDERVKRAVRPFLRGLSDLLGLRPILHGYTAESGLDQTRDDYAGFSAQNVQAAIPEAVGVAPSGDLTLADRPIVAALVNAVQTLAARVATLEGR